MVTPGDGDVAGDGVAVGEGEGGSSLRKGGENEESACSPGTN